MYMQVSFGKWPCALLVLAVGVSLCACHYRPLRLDGEKFPVPEQTLLRVRDQQDTNAMRRHAWALWRGLTRGSRPVWDTWDTKCDVGLHIPKCAPSLNGTYRERLFRSIEFPQQFLDLALFHDIDRAAPEVQLQLLRNDFQHDRQLAEVLYNKEAAQHIRRLPPLREAAGKRMSLSSAIAPFPPAAVAVKLAWQVVPIYDAQHVAGPVYVWTTEQFNANRNKRDISLQPDAFRTVNIDMTAGKRCGDRDYTFGEKIPEECLVAIEIRDPKEWDRIDNGVIKIVAGQASVTPLLLVLTAVHVTTKEIGDWTWTTFWWSPFPSLKPFGSGRPRPIRGPWRYFLMDTTFSETTPPDPYDGGNKIVFNPYLEAPFHNGIVSNCMHCHRYAAVPESDRAYALGAPRRNGEMSGCTQPNPRQCTDPAYFDQRTTLDFLWSLTARDNARLERFWQGLYAYASQRNQ